MKNFKKMLLTGAIATLMGASAMAAEVGDINTFTSGQPAQAQAVNANFNALIDAINDNNNRIAALEAAQGINSSLAGRQYKLRNMGWILAASSEHSQPASMDDLEQGTVNGGFARIGFYSMAVDLVLATDNTFTMNGAESQVEMFVNPNSNIGSEEEPAISMDGTWSHDGNILTLTFGQQYDTPPASFSVSKGGLVLTFNSGGLEHISPIATTTYFNHEYHTNFIIAVEVDAP